MIGKLVRKAVSEPATFSWFTFGYEQLLTEFKIIDKGVRLVSLFWDYTHSVRRLNRNNRMLIRELCILI